MVLAVGTGKSYFNKYIEMEILLWFYWVMDYTMAHQIGFSKIYAGARFLLYIYYMLWLRPHHTINVCL